MKNEELLFKFYRDLHSCLSAGVDESDGVVIALKKRIVEIEKEMGINF
jgi:hypothetical protein